jgi:hypothetical protein
VKNNYRFCLVNAVFCRFGPLAVACASCHVDDSPSFRLLLPLAEGQHT